MILTYAALALTGYLVLAAAWDLRTRRVPNWLTLPGVAGVLAWRLAHLDVSFLPFWVACLLTWHLNLLGGGDVKLLLVLFGLFPEVELFYVFLGVTAVVLAVLLVWRRARSHRLGALVSSLTARLVTLRLVPSREQLEEQGEPFAFLISLAGVVYVWGVRGLCY